MSAFAGLFRRDGAPVAAHGARAMEAASQARGPLFWHCRYDWAAGASQPVAGRDDAASIAVAADVRLDNSAELSATLGCPPGSCDAEIIAAAYGRWGEDCPARLEGDFAFIVHDRRRDLLFCARDHLGVRPFYYHLDDRLFAAATAPSMLTAIPAISDDPDEAGIASLMAGGYADRVTTIHRGIKRLPPGHALRVTRTASHVTGFWSPADVPPRKLTDAPEAFRSLFHDAVRRRLDKGSTGVMLSGGLDSSSVALEAASICPVRTLSLTLDGSAGWNERPYIEAVLDAARFDADFIAGGDHDPLEELPGLLAEQDGPFIAYNASLSRRLYARAAQTGIGVLLDGHGGDEVVSHGLGRLNELAARGQWRSLWREGAGIAGIYGASRWRILSPYLSHNDYVRAARSRWERARTALGYPRGPSAAAIALVSPALARRVSLSDRLEGSARRSARHSEHDLHVEALSAPRQRG